MIAEKMLIIIREFYFLKMTMIFYLSYSWQNLQTVASVSIIQSLVQYLRPPGMVWWSVSL
nr:hypothetical protein BCU62_03275 [Enterovibrio norvegicus]